MSYRNQIPHEWRDYYNYPAYFITYYGDIYFGYLWECPGHNDRFYIVQNDKTRDVKNLKKEEQTPERYLRLGREIKDPQIVNYDPIPHNQNQKLGVNINFSSLTRTGQRWKRMFVFGAGASAYCTFGAKAKTLRDSVLRPPTGYEIFDECYDEFCRKYPAVTASIPEFISKGNDIEACLEGEWQNIRNNYNPKIVARHVNLQYYLLELFQSISKEVTENHFRNNLYSLFANKLQKHLAKPTGEQVALVSFNYDTILDRFIEQLFSIRFSSTTDYINYTKNPFLLFKPHGSANWGWPFKTEKLIGLNGNLPQYLYEQEFDLATIYYTLLGNINQMVVENSWGMELSMHKHRLGRFTLNKNKIEVIQPNGHYYPALLLPYRDKDEFAMPYDHHNAMQVFMSEMEELYLIGWKGNEDVFNRLLKTHAHRLKKIVIASPSEKKDQEVSKNLSQHLGKLKDKYEVVIVNDFEDFVLNQMDTLIASEGT